MSLPGDAWATDGRLHEFSLLEERRSEYGSRQTSEQEGYPTVANSRLGTMNATDIACDIPQRNRPRALMTITSIVLGSVSLACIILRLLSRPPSPKRWTEMVDDWVLVANGVRQLGGQMGGSC